ncbi:hypothetical protein Leryth_023125 [Lithospermum erythrorhizon]|nr:hypothetical protein Leryth_023125 [Lithospermum erythrorhizon]
MLSETMDSPSSYNDEHFIHDERQDGFWKTNAVNQVYGTKSNGLLSQFAASPLEKDILMNSHIRNGFAPQDFYLSRDQRANPSSERFTSISEKGASMSLPRGFQHIIGSASYNTEGDKVNFTSAPYENGLFSMRLSSTNALFGHSVGAAEPHEDEEPFECLKELEAQTIGDLLPDDDEELFSGVADGINRNARLINGDEIEEDLFCSVGGLELGEDGDINSETLCLNSTSQLRGSNGDSEMEHPSACNAMNALQKKPLQNRDLDIHFSIPKDTPEKDVNQGTLEVFNMDSSVSNDKLRQIFCVYGEIKIYEVPSTNSHKFIEFYDVRAAKGALRALKKTDIGGKKISLEPSFLGSMYAFPSELDQENSSTYQQQSIPPSNFMTGLSGSISLEGMASNLDNGSVVDTRFSDGLPMSPYRENEFLDRISASVPNSLPSVLSVGSTGHIPNSIEASNSLGQLKFDIQGTPSFHCHSFSDHHNGLANGLTNIGGRSPELLEKPFGRVNLSGHPIDLNANVFNMNGNGSPGQQHYLWSNTPRPQPQGIWQNSPSFVNGACSPLLPQQMYTSKMLLAAIDERHRGNYDFLYLPIDFKNKCNVGYAFINMTEPTLIVPFYQALNGRKWEKFNSEKVASLAYARIQGKVALISHFQNSSLMNEDKRCHPILFHTEGPNAGDQVPFPMGVKIRPRGGKNRSNTSEENNQENPPNSLIDEESSNE